MVDKHELVKEKEFISAVIYVHNAEERVAVFLNSVISILESNFEKSEIICVNDNSDDDCARIIREAGKRCKNTTVSLVNMSFFHGLEAAMDAGNDLAIGDFVFEFDKTVLDFDETDIMRVYHKALEGYDIVSASPDTRQKLSSKIFYDIFYRFADQPYKMNTESFRLLSRRVINRVDSMNKTVPYRKVVYANSGLKTINLRYQVVQNNGTGKVDEGKEEKRYRVELAADTLILFTNLGYRAAVMMTVIMMLVAAFMVFYSFVIYILGYSVAGWTSTIMFFSVAFFGMFAIFTIVIKYLQILVNLSFKRKSYCYESNVNNLTRATTIYCGCLF